MSTNTKEYSYGEVIKQHRLELGLTQRQVADRCGITDSALAHVERQMRLPSEPIANRIAKALRLSDEVREEFGAGLKAARERQARERVRSRAAVKPILGRDAPSPVQIASDLAEDGGLLDAYRDLKAALRKPGQRKAVLRALNAWAREN